MIDAEESLSMEQLASLFPQLDNIQLIGTKGPQHIFSATLKSTGAPVVLRTVPAEEVDVFGWTADFLVKSRAVIEQIHSGLLRVYEVGQSGPLTFIISEQPSTPRLADLDPLPVLTPLTALTAVRNLAEGLVPLHRKGVFHGGITPKLVHLQPDGSNVQVLPINIYPAQPPVDMGDFASPEWVTGASTVFTPGMDIYALGLTLYILLTRTTPLEADFQMPSALISCGNAVDDVVARSITPNARERYQTMEEFITDLDKAIANPAGRLAGPAAAVSAAARPAPIPISVPVKHHTNNLYYYLIPPLIIGIVMTYTTILYKTDVATIRHDLNEHVQKENKAKADVVRKANKEQEEARLKAIAKAIAERKAAEDASSASADPQPAPVTPKPVHHVAPGGTNAAIAAEPGHVNWSLQPGVKARQSSNRNMLDAYGPEKAIDGNTSASLSDVSISATGVTEGKPSWFGLDFGQESNRTIDKVVICTPGNLSQLGAMEEFKVVLYDNDKKVLAEKTFTTTIGAKEVNVTTWALDAPVTARALRVETVKPDRPVALTEVEVFGPEEKSAEAAEPAAPVSEAPTPETTE